ncbi:MarR family winged helix-turn-helix transcriptional regulator [Sphingosinicella sp. LY1275]|uniref:MarR family winged helix-turn-helix transcriptional regulator n=1 Tax=Sphingosinicella sp. LY1275 TaxID=3095379 RepID=UPI002ADEACB8|nr:MarR family transcriptional regulator [Sphingosinicella sp. LY1275]MEA1013719.1 MarR family transcriptional regulator [Sphingosinicella sp. LY1275]
MRDEEDWKLALTWMILPVGRTWYRAASKAFEDFGMSFSTAAPILAIAKLGDGSRQNVVAEAIGVDRAAMVRSVDQLESLGLVERRTDPDDRRGRKLHLTDQGRSLAKKLDVVASNIRKHALASVTAEDGSAAVRVLQHLERAAEQMLQSESSE